MVLNVWSLAEVELLQFVAPNLCGFDPGFQMLICLNNLNFLFFYRANQDYQREREEIAMRDLLRHLARRQQHYKVY